MSLASRLQVCAPEGRSQTIVHMRLYVAQGISRGRPYRFSRLLIRLIARTSNSNSYTDGMLRCCVIPTPGRHLCEMSEHVNDILSHFTLKRDIQKWLGAPLLALHHHHSAWRLCRQGTGEWFLHKEEFIQWKTERNSAFWVHGKCRHNLLSVGFVFPILMASF